MTQPSPLPKELTPSDLAQGKAYTAPGITVYYNARRCVHVANCIRGLPQVFDTAQRPWIQPWQAPAERVAAVVRTCPTGALHYALETGEAKTPTVYPILDGPLAMSGNLSIQTPSGEVRDVRAALCHCGASGNKPFCDGTHAKVGWKSGGAEVNS
ncbi:(4Fe-4S)-binding protein [Deinococcus sp. SM5_A1]|uniref:(4Fe-4S)-binding protein n=1 Tax=Deinococcus sp. SM5_A1 TaxID=3379094 RepID=UPI0038584EB3